MKTVVSSEIVDLIKDKIEDSSLLNFYNEDESSILVTFTYGTDYIVYLHSDDPDIIIFRNKSGRGGLELYQTVLATGVVTKFKILKSGGADIFTGTVGTDSTFDMKINGTTSLEEGKGFRIRDLQLKFENVGWYYADNCS